MPAELIPGLSVVVPVYNSCETLGKLVDRLGTVLAARGPAYELILVNDGSRDGSWNEIRRLVDRHHWIRGINLMRNYGQHSALLAGLRAARYDVTVTLDDDLQNPPEEIAKLLGELAGDCDVVYGTPTKREETLWRRAGSALLRLMLRSALGAEVARNVSSFRTFRTQLRDAFADYHSSFVSIDVLLTWGTTRFSAVPVRHEPRRSGQSNYRFGRLLAFAIDVMTGFSTWPLRLASFVGFAFTVFGAVVLAWVLGRYLVLRSSVPGFPFLASVIAIFAGAQLFALGIIGEYLARMHFRSMGRPYAVIRDRAGGDLAHSERAASSR